MSIKPLQYEIKDLGKYMKSSKKKYIWRFEIQGREHNIELEYSILSGKRKIIEDGKVLFEGAQVMGAAFQFPFTVEGNSLNIIQQGESFELRINNQVFTHLWQQAKTKSEFQFEDEINKKESTFGKPDEKWSGSSFVSSDKKPDDNRLKFSVNLNFQKKEPQKTESSSLDFMTNSMPFPQDFTNFSKTPQKKNSDFDFNNFDFNNFSAPPKQENLQAKGEPKFPEVNFANLGRFSIPALKKPPVAENLFQSQHGKVDLTQSTILPKNSNIDLLDLVDEPPKKQEKTELPAPNTGNSNPSSNWDPFSQEKPQGNSANTQTDGNAQPELFDLVFSESPKTEEKPVANVSAPGENPATPNLNLQDVFNNPKQKEAEERIKKISLLDNAFGPSYNVGYPMMTATPNMMNMNMMNMMATMNMMGAQNMMSFGHPGFQNANFNSFGAMGMPNMFAATNFGPNVNQTPSTNVAGFNNINNNLNSSSTPFDKFK